MTHARLLLLGTVLLALAPGAARASISWGVDFSQSTTVVSSDSGQSQVTLSQPAPVAGQGNAVVTAPTMTVQSTAPDSHPDTFTQKGYQLNMVLTDSASGASTTVTVNGYIQGTASQNTVNLQDVLTGVTSYSGMLLGQNVYNVNVIGGAAPASAAPAPACAAEPPLSGSAPPTNTTPEPTGLVLAGLGCGCVVLGSVRRSRTAGLANA